MIRSSFWCALLFIAVGTIACSHSTPEQRTWNFKQVGIATADGKRPDRAAYSKLAPWPNTDGKWLYSGCYDPAELATEPGLDRCFMTVDISEPKRPRRVATVYSYDRGRSPSPPPGHIVWRPDYPFPNLPVKTPCNVDWADPEIMVGRKAPQCWDPGWNTHTHYVGLGRNKVLAVNQERYRGGTNRQANYRGVKFYDVTDAASPRFLSYWEAPASQPNPKSGVWPDAQGVHHFNFDGDHLYVGTEYKGFIGKILVAIDTKDPRTPVEAGRWWLPGQKTPDEDALRDWRQQSQFWFPVVADPAGGPPTRHVGMHYVIIENGVAYLSYHQAGLIAVDVRDPNRMTMISRLDYLKPGSETDPVLAEACRNSAGGRPAACGNTHSAKTVPGRKGLLVVTDEYFTCPFGFMRLVDASDPRDMKILSRFMTPGTAACAADSPRDPANKAAYPLQKPSSHIANALNANIQLVAWFGDGLIAVDISDPKNPIEVGRYRYNVGGDYKDDSARLAGANTYDVTIGPEGNIYVPDATAGLRVLRYTGPHAAAKP